MSGMAQFKVVSSRLVGHSQGSLVSEKDFDAGEVEATIFPLVGTQTTVTVQPTSGANAVTNPLYTLTNCFLSSHTPIAAGDVGSTSPITLTFTGGTLTKATT